MQRKAARQLIADTRHLVGRELTFQGLATAPDQVTTTAQPRRSN